MTEYPELQLYVGGNWKSAGGQPVINSADESVIGTVPTATRSDLDAALSAAEEGLRIWSRTSPAKRSEIIMKAVALMRERVEQNDVASIHVRARTMIRICTKMFLRWPVNGMGRYARPAALLVFAVCSLSVAAKASDSVSLYAAGSLRDALNEVAQIFEARTGTTVRAKYGPSGLLKEEIAAGAPADLFASANMEHPQTLAMSGKSSPVVLFVRNRLCALARPGLAVDVSTLADRMLDPGIRLGTSTPKADPSGDYAWEVFRKIDAAQPGSFAVLEKKALQLVGGALSPPPASGRALAGELIADGKADIFLAYYTGAIVAQRENPGQQIVQLPAEFAVGADYGLTVMKNASPAAFSLALFIMSVDGQGALAKHGFAAPALQQK
jgi:molybdate transport system substrate-binding protein